MAMIAVTNAHSDAARRGIAVELALRLGRAADTPVCVVGADPTDRDVPRRLAQLAAQAGDRRTLELTSGARSMSVVSFADRRLCFVCVTDRVSTEAVLPHLAELFDVVVIDAPSRVGGGVGVARMLLTWLDALVVASGFAPDELAEARRYLDWLETVPSARGVDTAVVLTGSPGDAELTTEQLDRRTGALPVVARLPRLWGRARPASADPDLDAVFAPLVDWVRAAALTRS